MEIDLDRRPFQGHTYRGVAARDNARVQLGNTYNYGEASNHSHYYFCSSSSPSQQLPQSLTFCGHGVARGEGELLSSKRKRPSDDYEYKRKFTKEDSLEHVLGKLGKFSKSIQDQRIGKDAKKVARRIALVVDVLKRQAGLSQTFEPAEMEELHDDEDFENVDNSLVVAKRVDINTGFRRTKHTKLVRVVRKHDRVAFGQWNIALKTSTFEYRNEDGTQAVQSLSSLYLDPSDLDVGNPITVHFGEKRIDSAVSFINPVISAYRVIPNHSELFKVVINDDLEGLVGLLAEGKATIRDCGERGATLLHYACRRGSPKCCQFLADNGADIERIGVMPMFNDWSVQRSPLAICGDGMFKNSNEAHMLRCVEILLKSGADPTAATSSSYPPVVNAVETPAFLNIIVTQGMCFLDLKSFRVEGVSLWLNACGHASQDAPLVLQKLLDLGCNVAETDSKGHNCLFVSVTKSSLPEWSYEMERIHYLLSIFNEIHARDVKGRTIFDLVDRPPDGFCGSYQRDLWYSALERSGIDISPHIARCPRVPNYRDGYTPEHYHALKHLQSWNRHNFRSQMDCLLQEIPLDEEQALEMERWRQEGECWRKVKGRGFYDSTETSDDVEWTSDDAWETDDDRVVEEVYEN